MSHPPCKTPRMKDMLSSETSSHSAGVPPSPGAETSHCHEIIIQPKSNATQWLVPSSDQTTNRSKRPGIKAHQATASFRRPRLPSIIDRGQKRVPTTTACQIGSACHQFIAAAGDCRTPKSNLKIIQKGPESEWNRPQPTSKNDHLRLVTRHPPPITP